MKTLHLKSPGLPFDLDKTLECGQVFRWYKKGDFWNGVIEGNVVTICQKGTDLIYDGIHKNSLIRYFNLNLDLNAILFSIRGAIQNFTGGEPDTLFEAAAVAGAGLRIIRQDPWECLISFICSQNSNIPAIQKRISLLCSCYGKLLPGGEYSFPKPEELAVSDHAILRQCSTGYRSSYLFQTSHDILDNPELLTRLSCLSMDDAKQELMYLHGVGPKVADCVLLFAYNQYLAVPVDVWIRSIITRGYGCHIRIGGTKDASYNEIANFCRRYFGIHAGYAQQLLFATRLDLRKKIDTIH